MTPAECQVVYFFIDMMAKVIVWVGIGVVGYALGRYLK